MLSRIIAFVVGTTLAAKVVRLWADHDSQRCSARRAADTEAMARWEDEGGNPAPAQPSTTQSRARRQRRRAPASA